MWTFIFIIFILFYLNALFEFFDARDVVEIKMFGKCSENPEKCSEAVKSEEWSGSGKGTFDTK